jgi:hypothetical protein
VKKLRVKQRKLGREKALGLYYHGRALIEVDPRQKSRVMLDTLIHETLYHLLPVKGERWIRKAASTITRVLWDQDYRKVAR